MALSTKSEAVKTLRWLREQLNNEIQMFANPGTDGESADSWMELAEATSTIAARLIEFSNGSLKEAIRIQRS